METESSKQADEAAQEQAGDESVEDFKREMEEDPSRAPSGDDDLERQRGG
ncbi:MAG TPA: hypothetical protein VN238_15185 [Solirubrobacteraceae bacterium]|jgi:hypothetical protein|nr:hypothetical protein [Solirubrobacteraceae bacterium]